MWRANGFSRLSKLPLKNQPSNAPPADKEPRRSPDRNVRNKCQHHFPKVRAGAQTRSLCLRRQKILKWKSRLVDAYWIFQIVFSTFELLADGGEECMWQFSIIYRFASFWRSMRFGVRCFRLIKQNVKSSRTHRRRRPRPTHWFVSVCLLREGWDYN